MHARSVLPLAAAFAATFCAHPAFARIHRDVDKTFTVTPGGTLEVSTSGGFIHVTTGSGNEVRVVAHERIRADNDAEADKLLKNLDLEMDGDSAGVKATARYASDGDGFHWGSWPPVQVDFDVTVPAKYSAKLNTSGGDIRVADLDGTVRARTSGGEIVLGQIIGKVDADTSGGDVELAGSDSDIELRTSGGNIRVGVVKGSAEVHTSGGNIEIKGVGGPLVARTSGGNIEAHLDGPLTSECSLSTSGGEVKAYVRSNAGFYLDADTSGGSVNVAGGISVTVESGGYGKSHLHGTVGAGGPKLRLRTSGGDILVNSV
ncbi:MAG TPA: DUF4097 family beta strand repeat-containing protein [Opitutaceae bacterium]|jgi:hypothetical protein